MTDQVEDSRWMLHALALARRGLGQTAPNPAVGCVLVKNGRVLGRGMTQPGGRPHAEIVALEMARERSGAAALLGATAYVTLEPCAHTGKTGPCAEALIAAGLARVVVATLDPDPRVSGAGVEKLKKAGIDVLIGPHETEAIRLNAGFLQRQELGRPFLTLKLASSLDGRIATRTGDSQWITGPSARTYTHWLRMTHEAILVGSGTVLSDNPRLTVRLPGVAAQPISVVADGRLQTPLTSTLVRSAADRRVIMLCSDHVDAVRRQAFVDCGIEVFSLPKSADEMLDLAAGLQVLARAGINRVLCEGGGRLAASLLRADLVDELVWLSAGVVIGADGLPSVAREGIEKLADASRYSLDRQEVLGNDVLTVWRKTPG